MARSDRSVSPVGGWAESSRASKSSSRCVASADGFLASAARSADAAGSPRSPNRFDAASRAEFLRVQLGQRGGHRLGRRRVESLGPPQYVHGLGPGQSPHGPPRGRRVVPDQGRPSLVGVGDGPNRRPRVVPDHDRPVRVRGCHRPAVRRPLHGSPRIRHRSGPRRHAGRVEAAGREVERLQRHPSVHEEPPAVRKPAYTENTSGSPDGCQALPADTLPHADRPPLLVLVLAYCDQGRVRIPGENVVDILRSREVREPSAVRQSDHRSLLPEQVMAAFGVPAPPERREPGRPRPRLDGLASDRVPEPHPRGLFVADDDPHASRPQGNRPEPIIDPRDNFVRPTRPTRRGGPRREADRVVGDCAACGRMQEPDLAVEDAQFCELGVEFSPTHRRLPDAASQNATRPRSSAVATDLPSELQAMCVTSPSWPASRAGTERLPVVASQMSRGPPRVATDRPSGENANIPPRWGISSVRVTLPVATDRTTICSSCS